LHCFFAGLFNRFLCCELVQVESPFAEPTH
jgi:hypothetical protein